MNLKCLLYMCCEHSRGMAQGRCAMNDAHNMLGRVSAHRRQQISMGQIGTRPRIECDGA